MTTYVPLASDHDGTLSVIAVGDWLLQLIKHKRPGATEKFYDELIGKFTLNAQTKEQEISDHVDLITLLLSHESLVFECMQEAYETGEVTVIVTTPDGGTDSPKEREVKKTYSAIAAEVEELFGVLMSLLTLRVPDPVRAGTSIDLLISVFRKSTTQLPEFRLKLLEALYNAFPPNYVHRHRIYMSILEYAAEASVFNLVVPYFRYIDDWMLDWKLPIADQRKLFFFIATELKKLKINQEAYCFLRRYLEGFQGESHDILTDPGVIAAAAELAVQSIRLPEILYFDELLELDAIQPLKTSKHKDLYKLLEIYRLEGPKEFTDFVKSHPDVLTEHDLSEKECLDKIRLLAVASCCVDCSTMKLDQMGVSLGLSEGSGDVEDFVVQAIGQGLVNAKLNQIERTVEVKSAMHRQFAKPQWEYLLKRLNIWQDSVTLLKKAVTEGKLAFPADKIPMY